MRSHVLVIRDEKPVSHQLILLLTTTFNNHMLSGCFSQIYPVTNLRRFSVAVLRSPVSSISTLSAAADALPTVTHHLLQLGVLLLVEGEAADLI